MKVDENFGKPMANAEQFKDMTCNIKIGKKRTYNETFPVATPGEGENNDLKKKKIDENGTVQIVGHKGTVDENGNNSDKENALNNL